MNTKHILPAAIVALVLPLPALAQTETVDGIEWNYTVSDGEAYLSKLSGYYLGPTIPISTSGAITIPSALGGYPVTAIGNDAFDGCSGLTSVTIPDSVTYIGHGAFYGCSGLTSMTIPNSVESIGDDAFCDCSGLKSVTIGSGVTSIGESAFEGCRRLTSVTIPNSVTYIDRCAFNGCSGLKSVTIGSGVTRIGGGAFHGCSALTSVTIGCSVTRIGDDAFYQCRGLTSVTIPDSVASIGARAFFCCSGLKMISIPYRFRNQTNGWGGWGLPSGCKILVRPVVTYAVKFSANGGKLPKGKKMAAQTFTDGKSAKLRKNVFTRKGCVFIGWAKSKKGAVAYKNAQSVKNLRTDGGTTTLYAVWAKKSYKVAFYANGGKGKMAAQAMTYGKAKKLTANKFKAPKGKKFAGWAKSKADAKAGKVAYKNKKSVKNLTTTGKTVKLYAVWKK